MFNLFFNFSWHVPNCTPATTYIVQVQAFIPLSASTRLTQTNLSNLSLTLTCFFDIHAYVESVIIETDSLSIHAFFVSL